MIYVASPYSTDAHDDSVESQALRKVRYDYVNKRTAGLLRAGNFAYSPIVHCHPMAVEYGLPKEYDFWKNIDEHMISKSDYIIVLCMEAYNGKTWKDSKGVQAELVYAMKNNKQVIFLDCDDYCEVSMIQFELGENGYLDMLEKRNEE